MAKLKSTNFKASGKLGEEVFIDSKAYGYHVRKAPKPGSKKEEPAFREQHIRTRFLNELAGELNRCFSIYQERLKSSDLYVRLQQCFRKEPMNSRFLLLMGLKGLELNPAYPLNKLGYCKTAVKGMAKGIMVSLLTEHHPTEGRYHANCYYNELLLLSWDKSKAPATIQQQFSEWIYLKDGKPEFEFLFRKPAGTKHWLLCLRQCLGINEKEVSSLKGEGMQVVEAGSFDQREQALWEKRVLEKQKRPGKESIQKQVKDVVRVKAKRVR